MVTRGGRIVDIGTDHAYIPMYLVKTGAKERGLACDVNKGPLAIAGDHIREEGLESVIGTCLSDGLENVDVEHGDSIVIAGMGGLLMKDILERGVAGINIAGEMILQPQSDYGDFRRFLAMKGLIIEDEEALIEDGKFYFVIRCLPGGLAYSLTEEEEEYGPKLLAKRHPVLKDYLKRQQSINENIISELNKQTSAPGIEKRKDEVLHILETINKTLGDYYEM